MRINTPKSLTHAYKMYKPDIPYKKFKELVMAYNAFMMKKVMEGHRVQLPGGAGYFEVIGKKQKPRISEDGLIKGLAPDWKATREYRVKNPDSNKILFHTNPDTDGVRFKLKWSIFTTPQKNKLSYYLRIARGLKREISRAIKENSSRYKVIG